MNAARWGVVIQGPRMTFGQGPNNTPQGFDSADVVGRNVRNFRNAGCEVVVSSWLECELSEAAHGARLVESSAPRFDPDNRRKQFVSMLAGCQALSKEVTHVLKIRTDQLVPTTLLEWIESVVETDLSSESRSTGPGRIVVSEFLPIADYYVGDFVFGGKRDDVQSFAEVNVGFGPKVLHPTIGVDYVLKYLSRVEPSFEERLSPLVPYAIQIADPRNVDARDAWHAWKYMYFVPLPREEFMKFEWRGRDMPSVLDWSRFEFNDEAQGVQRQSSPGRLTAWRVLASKVYEAYSRYWRARRRATATSLVRALWFGRCPETDAENDQ